VGHYQIPNSEHSGDSVLALWVKLSRLYTSTESRLWPNQLLFMSGLQLSIQLTVCNQLDFNLVQQFLLSWVPTLIMIEGCKPVFQTPFPIRSVELVEFRCKLAQFDFLSEKDTRSFISKFAKDAKAII
jgi:hypothetical protein